MNEIPTLVYASRLAEAIGGKRERDGKRNMRHLEQSHNKKKFGCIQNAIVGMYHTWLKFFLSLFFFFFPSFSAASLAAFNAAAPWLAPPPAEDFFFP